MKAASDTGLLEDLKKSFPGKWNDILSLTFFAAHKGLALSQCETWSESHCHPSDWPISSQRISELLERFNLHMEKTSALAVPMPPKSRWSLALPTQRQRPTALRGHPLRSLTELEAQLTCSAALRAIQLFQI